MEILDKKSNRMSRANAGVPDGASDTLGHISKAVGLNVPNMAKIGLGNILFDPEIFIHPDYQNQGF